jgi:hypothetical protein
MAALVAAAGSSLEMIGGGKYSVSVPVEIEVFFRVGQTGTLELLSDLSEDGGGITQFLG